MVCFFITLGDIFICVWLLTVLCLHIRAHISFTCKITLRIFKMLSAAFYEMSHILALKGSAKSPDKTEIAELVHGRDNTVTKHIY